MSNISLEQWMALASGLVLVVPVVVRWIRGRLPDSLSAMALGRGVGRRALWTLWIYAAAGLMCYPLFCLVPGWMAWLTVLMWLTVGTIPLIRGERNTEHYVYGVAAGAMSQVCVVPVNASWLWLWLVWLLVFVWKTCGTETWEKSVLAAELVCTATLCGSMVCR